MRERDLCHNLNFDCGETPKDGGKGGGCEQALIQLERAGFSYIIASLSK